MATFTAARAVNMAALGNWNWGSSAAYVAVSNGTRSQFLLGSNSQGKLNLSGALGALPTLGWTPTAMAGYFTDSSRRVLMSGSVTLASNKTLASFTMSYDYYVGSTQYYTVSGATMTATQLSSFLATSNDTQQNFAKLFVGNDSINGSSGGDALYGYTGNDILRGYAGVDVLNGGDGSDTLIGGAEGDVLTGGANNDIFRYTAPSEGNDTITDYNGVAGDALQFVSSNFGNLPVGSTLPTGRLLAPGTALPNAACFVYNQANGVLNFDSNGSVAGGVSTIATLSTRPAITDLHFQIVAA